MQYRISLLTGIFLMTTSILVSGWTAATSVHTEDPQRGGTAMTHKASDPARSAQITSTAPLSPKPPTRRALHVQAGRQAGQNRAVVADRPHHRHHTRQRLLFHAGPPPDILVARPQAC